MADEELRVGGFRDVHSGRWRSPSDRIYPCSTRLPVDFSHAVAIMLHLGTLQSVGKEGSMGFLRAVQRAKYLSTFSRGLNATRDGGLR